jgi:hypothetical protein
MKIRLVNPIFYLCILVLVCACTANYIWVNPTRPSADYQIDLYECGNIANQSIPVYNASDYVAPPVINVGPSPNLSCNEIDSSPVNCFSATPQSPIPLTDSQRFGKDDYHKFIDLCLDKRGWIKKVSPK